MHRGRLYPYADSYWWVEAFFWPGNVPRKIYIQCPVGYGSSWDRLAAGVVTDVPTGDSPVAGDAIYRSLLGGGAAELQVIFHKVSVSPTMYSVTARIAEVVPGVASLAYGFVASPAYTFAGPPMVYVTTAPPYSLGSIPPILIRAATWAEV